MLLARMIINKYSAGQYYDIIIITIFTSETSNYKIILFYVIKHTLFIKEGDR